MVSLCDDVLIPLKEKLPRYDLLGNMIPDYAVDDNTLDEHESKRRFYDSIRIYIIEKADKLAQLRLRYNLPAFNEPPDSDYMEIDDSYFPSAFSHTVTPTRNLLTYLQPPM
jgi:DNA-directed RNA polymerase III subunit RPC1